MRGLPRIGVGAVHRQAGHRLDQRLTQLVQPGCCARRAALRDTLKLPRKTTRLRAELLIQHLALAAQRGLCEADGSAREATIGLLDCLETGGSDEQILDFRQEVVARRTGDRPLGGKPLLPGQYLLDEQGELAIAIRAQR